MVFILLIFFIVTTTFTRETGVEVKRPRATSASEVKDKIIKVAITREGTIHVFEKQVDLFALETILKRERARDANVQMVILADGKAITERVVDVIDRATRVGIVQTSIAALKN
ncbi:biopolymer transporter ExbD [Spirochaetota bacterium]|nr:biopolymer transporter ExbD [Spirochaetota bacterium]